MKFSQMFQDDKTGQLSLTRVAIGALIAQYLLVSTIWFTRSLWQEKLSFMDVPAGVIALATLLYGVNKTVSNFSGKAASDGDTGNN